MKPIIVQLREGDDQTPTLIEGIQVGILAEASVRSDGTIPVKIIAPGWGSSGYYSAEVLERDGPSVFTTGLQMYWDHPTESEKFERPERSLRDLAGQLTTGARWVNEQDSGGNGAGLYAEAKVFDPFRSHLDELAPHIGLSIRAFGETIPGEAQGRQGNIVTRITEARSVDFVTRAGAGGKVLQLFEAARPSNKPREERMPELLERELQEARAQVRSLEDEVRTLKESNGTLTKERDEAKDGLTKLGEAHAKQTTALRTYQGRDAIVAAISEDDTAKALPEPVRKRICEAVKVIFKDDGSVDTAAVKVAVTEAVKTEKEYLESIVGNAGAGTGTVTGLGESVSFLGGGGNAEDADKKLNESLVESFVAMGMTEAAAKIAAGGR